MSEDNKLFKLEIFLFAQITFFVIEKINFVFNCQGGGVLRRRENCVIDIFVIWTLVFINSITELRMMK